MRTVYRHADPFRRKLDRPATSSTQTFQIFFTAHLIKGSRATSTRTSNFSMKEFPGEQEKHDRFQPNPCLLSVHIKPRGPGLRQSSGAIENGCVSKRQRTGALQNADALQHHPQQSWTVNLCNLFRQPEN